MTHILGSCLLGTELIQSAHVHLRTSPSPTRRQIVPLTHSGLRTSISQTDGGRRTHSSLSLLKTAAGPQAHFPSRSQERCFVRSQRSLSWEHVWLTWR